MIIQLYINKLVKIFDSYNYYLKVFYTINKGDSSK